MSALPHELTGLPRELAAGVHWLGTCHAFKSPRGGVLHTNNSMYLVCGEDAARLAATGAVQAGESSSRQLDELMSAGAPPVRWVWPTHQETPHSGGIARWMARFPDAQLCGNVQDYHLLYPELEHRFEPMTVGDRIDLGGTELVMVEPVLRDLSSTLWAFHTRGRVLFTSDGYSLFHYHDVGHCGRLADEVIVGLDLEVALGLSNDIVLYWSRFLDIDPYIDRIEALVRELGVEVIASTHGLPIVDLPRTLPVANEALRRQARRATSDARS